jgi:hypothetical protein
MDLTIVWYSKLLGVIFQMQFECHMRMAIWSDLKLNFSVQSKTCHVSAVQCKHPLQESVFPFRQKAYTFNGADLSPSSGKG